MTSTVEKAQAMLDELRALPTVDRLDSDWQSDATVRRLIYTLQDYVRDCEKK